MGTRGAFGLHRNGKTKAMYNHYDSYPSDLGENIVKSLSSSNIAELQKTYDNITLVDGNSKPTEEQVKECLAYWDNGVSTGSVEEWYSLIREAQGNMDAYLREGLKYMIDGQDFLKDSLFCEWAYIVNLDSNVLEVYKGFQTEPDMNRYYDESLEKEEYKNCKLIASIELEDIFNLEDGTCGTILKDSLGEVYY